MKISMALGAGATLDPKSLTRQVQDLESAGVDLVWGGEIYGFDLVSTLTFVAAHTEKMQIMTGILPIYSRSPALIAQTAMHPAWTAALLRHGMPRFRTLEKYVDEATLRMMAGFVGAHLGGTLSWDYLAEVRELWSGPRIRG